MSICNVAITPGKILVAVDTAVAGCRIGDTPTRAHMQKAVLVGDTLIASRGGVSTLYYAALHAMSINAYIDIDMLAVSLPLILPQAHRQTLQARTQQGGKANKYAEGCEMTIAGWSKQGAPRALIATMTPDGRCEVEEIHTTCAAPGIPGAEGFDLNTPQAMLEASRAQVKYFAETDPAAPIGGELVLYELMQGGVIVRKLGPITDQQEATK